MGMSAWWDLTPVQPGRVYRVHLTPRALTDAAQAADGRRDLTAAGSKEIP